MQNEPAMMPTKSVPNSIPTLPFMWWVICGRHTVMIPVHGPKTVLVFWARMVSARPSRVLAMRNPEFLPRPLLV